MLRFSQTIPANGRQAIGLGVKGILLAAGLWLGALSEGLQAQHSSYNLPAALPKGQIAPLEAKRRQIFNALRHNPANLDLAFAYAGLSAKLGDLEAAAGTYEAMLLRAPAAARVRLDLAATYYRLGAYAAAKEHFEAVVQSPETPAPVRENIARYLAAIAQRKGVKNGFSGSVSLGLRYQSNANSAPEGETVTLNGIARRLVPDSQGRDDFSANFSAQINHRMAMGEGGHGFLTALSLGFGTFREVGELRNAALELRLGPEFALEHLGGRGFLALQAQFSQSRLGGADYLRGRGLSLGYRRALAKGEQLSAQISWRQESYDDNALRRRASEHDGKRWRLSLSYFKPLAKDWQFQIGLRHDRRSAKLAQNAYRESGINLALNHQFASPFAQSQPWTLGLQASLAHRDNEAANPLINAAAAQSGTEYMIQAVQSIPLQPNLGMQIFLGRRGIKSNYDTRDFDDRYVGLTLMKRF